ncbi:MAG: hypothetical protein RLZZ127_603 [Planctomycetota bacterium]|jgi:2-keto-3-deoxygluconate permease
MRIKHAIERIPGGMMIIPLLLGALLNTIDQARLAPINAVLAWMGAVPAGHAAIPAGTTVEVPAGRLDALGGGKVQVDGAWIPVAEWKARPADPAAAVTVLDAKLPYYEFLRVGSIPAHKIGSFTEQLFKSGALCLIALFLLCAAAQMHLRVGARALGKGMILTGTKFAVGVGVGWLVAVVFGPFEGFLGLATITIIAAMTNGNGGMYAALTGQYGNRSDVGALSILSLNDGPFLTMVGLGILGTEFPLVVFLGVLIPIVVGMVLGNLDEDIRTFLAPGEKLLIPFFAFALGANMNFATFLNPAVAAGGILLGVMTTVLTGFGMWLVFTLFRIRSRIAAFAEASVAGNATATPAAIAAAAAAAGSADAAQYQALVGTATAQISIAVITTALLCPIAVVLVDRWQRARGIEGAQES